MTDPAIGGQDEVMLASATASPDSQAERSVRPLGATLDFRATFDEQYAFVWRSLAHMGVSAAAIDDNVQEVFLVVHRRLADYDASQPLRAWLWGIARGIANNHRRARGRDARRHDALAQAAVGAPAPSPERAGELAFVREILMNMDEASRDVLVLSDVEGLTAPEISAALGVNPNTVYSRLRSARTKFAEAARRAGHSGGEDGR